MLNNSMWNYVNLHRMKGRFMNTIGNKIRMLRKKLKMTQDELAGQNISKSYISHIELGKVNPSIATLGYIAGKLNTPVAFFLQDDIIEEINNDYSSLIKQGEDYIEKYDYHSGLSVFNTLIDKRKKLSLFDLGLVWYYKGFCTFKIKGTENAKEYILKSIDCFEKLLNNLDYNLSDQISKIYIKLAENHYILNNKKSALDYFLKAKKNKDECKINKEDYIYILRNICILYIHFGSFQTAINYLSELVDISKKENLINENIISTYINQATCYYYLEQYEQSLDILNNLLPIFKFLDRNKQLCSVYIKIARNFLKLEKYTEVLECLKIFPVLAKSIIEDDIRIFYELQYELIICEIEFINSKTSHALFCIQKIVDTIKALNRNDDQFNSLLSATYIVLGKIHLSNNNLLEAKTMLENSINILETREIFTQLPDAHNLLAETLIMLKDPRKAQFHYEKAIDILTKNKF